MATADILARVRKGGDISSGDALEMRRAVYGNDGAIDRAEIETMLAIDEAAKTADPSWSMLLSEAVTDFIVHQQEPWGYVSEANASWLTGRMGEGGKVKTPRQLEALVKVLEAATESPPALVAFALDQVKMAVIDGEGPLAAGGDLDRGRVTAGEVALLRRILYASAGSGGIGVTRAEAEVLFDINDATATADNDPAWGDLFVKAITNCIMAAHGYAPQSREQALAEERWLDSPSDGLGGFFSKMVAGGLGGVIRSYTMPSDQQVWAEKNAAEAAAAREAEIVTSGEGDWLAARIGRDGRLGANEVAVLKRIRDEASDIPPALRALVDRAA